MTMSQPIRLKRLPHGDGLPLPSYATPGSAGMDIATAVTFDLRAGHRKAVPTGFAVAVPAGHELQVRPRSGLALKEGITVINTPGTIDEDYRGELHVILINHSGFMASFKRGDRIAQLVLAPVTRAVPVEVDTLDETTRGEGGFGSTGR
ncbi:MAG: dUTP diphosphatase [Pseudomonadota bacterium]|jgi:dUTP pyrophosphatase